MVKKYSKNDVIVFFIALFGLLIDQITKYFTVLYLNEPVRIINGVFHLAFVKNYGGGFGILQNHAWFFIIFTGIVITAMIVYYKQIPDKFFVKLCFMAILAGAVGNLIDRIRFSYVIDFIDLRIWPTFNIADIFITIGAIGLIWYIMKD